jgi:ubiquinone/menaquinone biosynthesis C-methylase UbiE
MSDKFLLALFGRNTDLISFATLIVFVALVVVGFCQGRPIQIGRFSIGGRPGASGPRLESVAPVTRATDSALPRDHRFGKVSKVFEVSHARQFYNAIASNYDERNSTNLIATQLETIKRLQSAREAKPALRVLDLGGGTGQNIATYFFSDPKICWTYVDFCPAMAGQLDNHLTGQPIFRKLNKIVGDINEVHRCLQPGSFDVVLLSLVLSSMPHLPDFTKIAGLLAPNGVLIISDINPAYTELHPYYIATAQDGSVVAMRMKPVDPVEICKRATGAGLHQPELTWQPEFAQRMSEHTVSYSFVATFVSPTPPRSRVPRIGRASVPKGRFRVD